jgi:membrane protein
VRASVWPALRHGVWPFLRRVVARYNADEGPVLSGYLAYSAMLSLMPFLVFATALAGFVVGPDNSEAALDMLFEGLPEHVARTLEPVVIEVVGQRRGGILTLSALGAVWVASNGIEALRVGFDRAYEVGDSRHVALNRVYAIAMVLIGFLIFSLLSGLVIVAPLAFQVVESFLGVAIPAEADIARYGVAFVILWLSLWILHRILPSRRMCNITLWPGILASVALWSAMASLMSVYLVYAPSYSLTYGTLAGVILTLLFFYLTAMALLIGAEVNAVVNRAHLAASKGGDAKPAPSIHVSEQEM